MNRFISVVLVTSTFSLPISTYAAPQHFKAIQGVNRTITTTAGRFDNSLLLKFRNAVNQNTVVVDGRSYPKNAYSESDVCLPGERKMLTGIAPIRIQVKLHAKKTDQVGPTRASWTASSDWGIEYATTHFISMNGSYEYSGSMYASNQILISNEQYSSIFSKLKKYIASLDITDVIKANLEAELEEYISNYKELSFELSSSHDTVFHSATVYGQGYFNGRSWVKLDLNVNLVCRPIEVRSPEKVTKNLKAWIDKVKASVGVTHNGPPPASFPQ